MGIGIVISRPAKSHQVVLKTHPSRSPNTQSTDSMIHNSQSKKKCSPQDCQKKKKKAKRSAQHPHGPNLHTWSPHKPLLKLIVQLRTYLIAAQTLHLEEHALLGVMLQQGITRLAELLQPPLEHLDVVVGPLD
jgi:hypothetical protein